MIRPYQAARPTRRTRPRLRPTLDRLEGRALMAFAGSLDPTFGIGGVYSAQFPPTPSTALSNVAAIATEPDGSIIEAGTAGMPGYSSKIQPTSYGVIHLTANGALDTSFGKGGEANLMLNDLATNGENPSLLIQPDGKILVFGMAYLASQPSTPDQYTVVGRFNGDGTPDTSFGAGGLVELGPGSSTYYDEAALQSNGQIVLAGTAPDSTTSTNEIAVTRLDANGQVDTSFGTGGVMTLPGNQSTITSTAALGVAVAPGGQIYVLGNSSAGDLFRLNSDGTIATSFISKGLQAKGEPDALAVQPNGQVLVLGSIPGTPPSGASIPFLDQLNTDGSLATAVTLRAGGGSLAFEPDGDVVIGPSQGSNQLPVSRLTPDLAYDASFGAGGIATIPKIPSNASSFTPSSTLAITPSGQIVAAATGIVYGSSVIPTTYNLVARLTSTPTRATPGDYTGDGISDPAVFLTGPADFVTGNSSGGPGQVVQLGVAGAGQTIPSPGDYYGTGQNDIAAYLPAYGTYDIKDPTGQTAGLSVPIGIPGAGQTIPAPGDYFANGRDAVAVYLVQSGNWDVLQPGDQAGVTFHFGQPGAGNTIPVPGDYYGTGQDDIAVYLAQSGVWSILAPGNRSGVDVGFGIPGVGNSIPVPGDYDGSGRTELAVYLPSLGEIIYRTADGKRDVTIPFGIKGAGQTLPAPGDYDGSGRTEAAAYLPGLGVFAYRPALGGPDVSFAVGFAGNGPIIPVTAVVPSPFPGTGSGSGSAIEVAGTLGQPDALDFVISSAAKKPKPGDPPAA